MGGSAIDPTILRPLLMMAVAFLLLFVTLQLAAMRNQILRRPCAPCGSARPERHGHDFILQLLDRTPLSSWSPMRPRLR